MTAHDTKDITYWFTKMFNIFGEFNLIDFGIKCAVHEHIHPYSHGNVLDVYLKRLLIPINKHPGNNYFPNISNSFPWCGNVSFVKFW